MMSKYETVKTPAGIANRFLHPFTMTIVGQTMSGKSQLIKEILTFRQQLFTTAFDRIFYCTPSLQFYHNQGYLNELKKICPQIVLIENEPSQSLIRGSQQSLFILDDLMSKIFDNRHFEELFTQSSHHMSNSVIYTSQNYFNTKRDQTIVRNLSYQIIFYRNADLRYMRNVSGQFSTDPKFFKKCFDLLEQEESPKELYKKFILIDNHPQNPFSKFPVRGMIMPRSDSVIRPLMFPCE